MNWYHLLRDILAYGFILLLVIILFCGIVGMVIERGVWFPIAYFGFLVLFLLLIGGLYYAIWWLDEKGNEKVRA
jgi:hypothetical protein